MPAEWLGAGAGLLLGVADFLALGMAARNNARQGRGGAASRPLRLIRVMSLFVFPIVGWFVGPILAESLGG